RVGRLFTEGELRAFQGVWDAIHTLYPDLSKQYFERYNRELGKIEAKPITFTSKEGKPVTLAGGYYPIIYDSTIDNVAAKQAENDLFRQQSVFRNPEPKKGFTKERTQGVDRPFRMDLGVLTDHFSDTAKFITHSRVIKDLDRVVKNPFFKESVTSKFGTEIYSTLAKWLRDMANPDPSAVAHRDFADQIADKLKTVVSHMFLGFNVPLAVAQVSGVVNGFHRIGGRAMMGGFKAVGFPGSVEVFLGKGKIMERVKELSDVVRLREKSLQREILDEVSKLRTDGKRNKLSEASFWLYQACDRFHTVPFWLGAFQKHMETLADRSKPHAEQIKEAAAYADALLLDTQPSALPAVQSELQRARTGLYRHFMMFSSFFTMLGNNISVNHRLAYEGKISPFKPAKYVASLWLAMVLEQSIKDLLKGNLPDWMNSMVVQPLTGFLGYFPGVKEVARLASVKKDGSLDLNTDRFTPPAFSAPLHVGKDLLAAVKKDSGYGPAIWQTAQMISAAYGIPVANVARWMFQMHDNLTESTDFKGYK
ncbi:MAG: hypothetical protein ACOYMV_13155, partial [Verrucomicrobiia bacterium]